MCVLQMSSGHFSQDLWFRAFQHFYAEILPQTVSLVNHEWLRIVRQLSNKYFSFTQDFVKGHFHQYLALLQSGKSVLFVAFPLDGMAPDMQEWADTCMPAFSVCASMMLPQYF